MPDLLCTEAEVLAMLKLTDKPPEAGELTRVVAAASSAIQRYAKRDFGPGAPAEERLFYGGYEENGPAGLGWVLPISDATAITLVEDLGGDLPPYPLTFELLPSVRQDGMPITGLLLPRVPYGRVQVTGTFGWAEIPAEIRQAAIEQACAWYTLDSARVSDAFADELNLRSAPPSRGLLYGVKDKVRPYRRVSMA